MSSEPTNARPSEPPSAPSLPMEVEPGPSLPPPPRATAGVGAVPPRPTPLRILRALLRPTPETRPPGVPKLRYRFPLSWLVHMGRDLLFARPRSFKEDCALAVRCLPRPPRIEGQEHVPAHGSVVLVANHYQRRDLWIGWVGGLLCTALWSARPEMVCHFVVEDRAVLDGASINWTRPIFARVARVWDLVLVTPAEARDANADGSRRRALRDCLRRLRRPDGRPVCLCIMPEGISGGTRGLIAPVAGSGRSLLALASAGALLLPAAVWEDADGALHARFGPAWRPAIPPGMVPAAYDGWAGDDAMRRIAALLPETFRGVYADARDPNARDPNARDPNARDPNAPQP
ncbi:MAG: hypothetical protein IVW57_05010 [Ktedonobacterales bacterium]|nr:hypothetical protein [Ktedonobacterales bacterium]